MKLPVLTLLLISVPELVFASHTHAEYSFDDGETGGWGSFVTTDGSPFGGRYLGPLSGGSGDGWFTLDALSPDGGGDDHQVQLQFDVVNFDPFTESLVISGTAGDRTYSIDVAPTDVISGSGSNFTFFLTFVLYKVNGCCTDLSINFLKESPGDWGLDNVIIDWATPVPLPAAGWLMAMALASLFVARIRPA